MKADLYDFDKTVFPTDSETVFWLFCLKKHPKIAVLIPYQAASVLCFLLGLGNKSRMKGRFFCFLRMVNGEALAKQFWSKYHKKIYPFFRPENRKLPAVVCSASPEFFLRPVCERLEVEKLIATKMNPKTGEILWENCKGREKVRRIREELPGYEFESVYSDSLKNDKYIMELGKRRVWARRGKLKEITARKRGPS